MDAVNRVSLQWVTNPSEPDEHVTRASDGNTVEVYRDAQVRIVSDRHITQAQAKSLATRIEAAYQWDEKKLGWDQTADLKPRLNVAVLSEQAFARFTGDSSGHIGGVTTGPNLFVVPSRVLGKMDKEDLDTVAHELTHVQDFREAGARMDGVPTYLVEGRAYVDGDGYAKNAAHIKWVLGAISGDDAQAIVEGFRHASDERKSNRFVFVGEVTGGLFVEWLRAHVKPDAMKRLSKAIEAVGDGKSFDAAFQQQFGVTLAQAEGGFVDFVRKTEGNPKARLAGTIYGS